MGTATSIGIGSRVTVKGPGYNDIQGQQGVVTAKSARHTKSDVMVVMLDSGERHLIVRFCLAADEVTA